MKNYLKKGVIGLGVLPFLVGSYCFADVAPFDSELWEFDAREATPGEYMGQQALSLNGGLAILDVEFTNGTIEFDAFFESDFFKENKGFIGSVFRLQDAGNYEKFYIRPHRMDGEPDAAQLVPVYNHWSSWELYWEGHYAPIQFIYDEWMHFKIIVSGEYAEVYAGTDMDNPVLSTELKRDIVPGKIGLKSDPSAPATAHFANFEYTIEESPELKNPPEFKLAPIGTVMSWSISEAFEASELEGKLNLTEEDDKEWEEWEADLTTGVMNLAKVHHIDSDPPNNKPGVDTVFVRTTIVSDKEQVKKLQFGFTDLVKVYFNGQLLYSENNAFGSRDYRFMGLMRYANELYLPLKTGENDLTLAVTGLFASWGVQARFEDLEGIELTTTHLPEVVDVVDKLELLGPGPVVGNAAVFAGGIALNGQSAFSKKANAKPTDRLKVAGQLIPKLEHVGLNAEVSVLVTYRTTEAKLVYFGLTQDGFVDVFDKENPPPFSTALMQGDVLPVSIFEGELEEGTYAADLCYKLDDGTKVCSEESIELEVSK